MSSMLFLGGDYDVEDDDASNDDDDALMPVCHVLFAN